ncbi:lytic transglycosylase domain-containing protein [Streptomyces sp. NPDC088560]|uniref:lytic transglycosylase domain-containing protein n=1 Tax=Streptomyces sp. NPDC088560 TaxID=3365868 RepID=UPI00381EDA8A
MSDSEGPGSGLNPTGTAIAIRAALAAGGAGCLASPLLIVGATVIILIFGGLGVILYPLISLILLFGGGKHHDPNPQPAIAAFQGDGKGDLDNNSVPSDLVDPIKKAGSLCSEIGPIVIASQIQQESGFDPHHVGQNGELGLSQLDPDVFAKFGEDTDGNGQVSALDAEDSIHAQGKYLCYLVDQVRPFAAREPMHDVLSLALAAYDVGLDAVRKQKAVPPTDEAQGYVLAIRANFARYSGVVKLPASASPSPSPSLQQGQ